MVNWLVVLLLIDWVHWFMWTLKNSFRTTMKMVLVAVRTMLCQWRWYWWQSGLCFVNADDGSIIGRHSGCSV